MDTEAYYNNFGERGYADIYIQKGNIGHVIEVKSSVSSSNKVIRQFKRMRNNFFEGSEHRKPCNVVYKLVFAANRGNIEHFHENINQYKTLANHVGLEKTWIQFTKPEEEPVTWLADKETFSDLEEKISEQFNISDFSKTKLECPYCGKQYKRESYYKVHVKGCFE